MPFLGGMQHLGVSDEVTQQAVVNDDAYSPAESRSGVWFGGLPLRDQLVESRQ